MLEKTFYKQFLSRAFDIPVKVVYWDGEEALYGGTKDAKPELILTFKAPIPIKEIRAHATLAFAEAYMNGQFDIDGGIQKLVTTLYRSATSFIHDAKFLRYLPKQKHTENESKKDVQSHYDIGNDFYKLWLDKTMTYSCAYFRTPKDTLEEAQVNKVQHILNKLDTKPGKHLLDIGCGWGTLMFIAAEEYGLDASGITLSQEQFDFVSKKIKEKHLESQVHVYLMDYREFNEGPFDYVTSVGMFEHVGQENLGIYFAQVSRLLKNDGHALIHGITGQHEGRGRDPFINKYVFPGGYIPNVKEMIGHIMDNHLQLSDLEPLRRHYQKTLELWDANFNEKRADVEALFDVPFARMWDMYLQASAASFESGNIDVIQYLITKQPSGYGLPMTRDFMTNKDNQKLDMTVNI